MGGKRNEKLREKEMMNINEVLRLTNDGRDRMGVKFVLVAKLVVGLYG